MRLEELKKGFWGYKREDVFRCITEQEEAFSQKLLEKDVQAEQAEQRARERIQELEQQVCSLQEELARLRDQQDYIARAILDARASAEALKAETRAQEEAARETVRRTLEEELVELEGYREKIGELHVFIRTTLETLDGQVQDLEQQVEKVSEAAPARNLTLFSQA